MDQEYFINKPYRWLPLSCLPVDMQELFIFLLEAIIKTTIGLTSVDYAYLVNKPGVAGAVLQTA